jgi:mannitol-1-phosphate 5-dehydrogenase
MIVENRTSARTYVGFGFGAIQPGLLLYDAFRAQAFDRYVVAEIQPSLVDAMRRAEGRYTFNIASMDGLRQVTLGPVELLDVGVPADRERLVAAIAEAHEIGTAITTFDQYVMDIPGSLHRMIAEGLRRKVNQGESKVLVYAAENHNRAKAMLREAVMAEVPAAERDAVDARVQFVNTVISKMCGLVTDREVIAAHDLAPMWPEVAPDRALLVEDYDRLLIDEVTLEGFERGITTFEEKPDLLPFKEAKLFGHNGTHAIAAYLAGFRGATRMTELRAMEDMLRFLRAAFLEEAGAALIRKYAGFDPLFTPEGFADFVDGVLTRMINSYLLDTVTRVGRDPRRKLGWEDRLVGTIRLGLTYGVDTPRYAFGAAAALATLEPDVLARDVPARALLTAIWEPQGPELEEAAAVLSVIEAALPKFKAWARNGCQAIEI